MSSQATIPVTAVSALCWKKSMHCYTIAITPKYTASEETYWTIFFPGSDGNKSQIL